MTEPLLIDSVSYVIFQLIVTILLCVVVAVQWRQNSAISGMKTKLDTIETNHLSDLAHMRKELRWLTGVIISHFKPYDEKIKREFDELENVD